MYFVKTIDHIFSGIFYSSFNDVSPWGNWFLFAGLNIRLDKTNTRTIVKMDPSFK